VIDDLIFGRGAAQKTINASDIVVIFVFESEIVLHADGIPIEEEDLANGFLDLRGSFVS
jgi:hypothetical protein